MNVTREYHLSQAAYEALTPAVDRANFDWADVARFMQGYGWAIWNVGGLTWVFTMVNADNEIEILLVGGKRAREGIPAWEAAMHAEPAHKGMTMRAEGRAGWARWLPHWERRGDVLYSRIA